LNNQSYKSRDDFTAKDRQKAFQLITPMRVAIKKSPTQARRLAPVAVAVVLLSIAGFNGGAAAQELPPLTTAESNPRIRGKFVWADLVTDDVAKARKFYADLFGWTFRNAGDYSIAANDERPLCGMFQKPRPKDQVVAPRWFGYISVPNVERAQRKAAELGARVLAPAQKMPKRGEQAVLADPEGAVFGLLKSNSGDPEDFLAEPGDWVWIQLLSRDAKKAADFYRNVAGYEVVENSSVNRLSDYVLTSKGYARATIRTIPKGREQVQANWLPFVRVKNVGESVVRAKQLGGKILIEPKAELFEKRVAVVSDPTGAAIGLMEWSPEMAKGGVK